MEMQDLKKALREYRKIADKAAQEGLEARACYYSDMADDVRNEIVARYQDLKAKREAA